MTGNKLRKLVKSKLLEVCPNVYYRLADDKNMYPHITFIFGKTRKYDVARNDVTMDVDIWTKSESEAQDMADEVESMFNSLNDPQEEFLPTFFVEGIKEIEDADKSIKRVSVEVTIQNYERS